MYPTAYVHVEIKKYMFVSGWISIRRWFSLYREYFYSHPIIYVYMEAIRHTLKIFIIVCMVFHSQDWDLIPWLSKNLSIRSFITSGVRGSVVGWGSTLQAGRSRDRIPHEVDFFNWPNPSSRTMVLGSTQPLTEMSTRNIPGDKGRPARKADNLTAICEPIFYKNVGASTSHSPMGFHGPLQG
jgi:hypothetical protein